MESSICRKTELKGGSSLAMRNIGIKHIQIITIGVKMQNILPFKIMIPISRYLRDEQFNSYQSNFFRQISTLINVNQFCMIKL